MEVGGKGKKSKKFVGKSMGFGSHVSGSGILTQALLRKKNTNNLHPLLIDPDNSFIFHLFLILDLVVKEEFIWI